MTFGFADWGIRCGQCGHSACYPKSAIRCDLDLPDIASVVRWGPVVLAAITVILLLGLIATRAHSAVTNDAAVLALEMQ